MPSLCDPINTVRDLGYIPAEIPDLITINQNLVLPVRPNQEQSLVRLFYDLNGFPKTGEHDPIALSHGERQRLTPTLAVRKHIPNQ